jgi:3'-phosphoadenosine 5'-phosphosulfate sulfotransferase (PAPS reductase)/FAD synthetase
VRQLRESYAKRGKHMMTTALIAGDCVILDLIAKEGLLDQTVVVFCDTLHLFAESLTFLKEIESKYGFKAPAPH